MRGKRVRTRSASRWRRSSVTGPPPVAVLADDRARHLVARRQLLGEPLARAVEEVGALAAHRFRDQEPRRARDRERRGMELHELHVEQRGARRAGPWPRRRRSPRAGWWSRRTPAPRRRWPAAWRGPAPASRRRRSSRKRQPTTRPSATSEVGRAGERAHVDARRALRLLEQRAHHLPAGGVAQGVQDAVARVRALAREVEAAVLAVEARAPGRQLADALRALLDQHARRRGGHDAGARRRGCRRGADRCASSGPIATATPPCA